MKSPLVSVVIPLYNSRSTIERAVQSVLRQTYPNIEVWVVDDGSDDDGLSLMEQLQDERIHCQRLSHRNANVARNYGILHSKGEYVAMLDADDYWLETHLADSLQLLQSSSADGVCGTPLIENPRTCQRTVSVRKRNKGERMIDYLLTTECGAQTSTLLMTAESAQTVLWDETLNRHQDYDFVVRYDKRFQWVLKYEPTAVYVLLNKNRMIDFHSCMQFVERNKAEISPAVYETHRRKLELLMQRQKKNSDTELLELSVKRLLVNAPFETKVGLYHGKMGIAIAFYYYAMFTQNDIYQRFADELIDQIYHSVHLNLPIDMENGLCGIAWGLCHLLRHGFLEGDATDVLEDIDQKIMERSLAYTKDCSLATGLGGIYTYVCERKLLADDTGTDVGMDAVYLHELDGVAQQRQLKYVNVLKQCAKQCEDDYREVEELPLGIYKGCAGLILKHIQI